ncbi:MAG: hypothetical protein ACXW38_11825 [Nitrospira sp.]
MIDQPRALATNPGGTTGLAQILAREAGADHFRVGRQALEVTNVGMIGNTGEACAEYRFGRLPTIRTSGASYAPRGSTQLRSRRSRRIVRRPS